MSDLQELLEKKRQDWTAPTPELGQQGDHRPGAPPAVPSRPQTGPKASPPEQGDRSGKGDRVSAKQDDSNSGHSRDHIGDLLAELETLPPHNSKLAKFIMRLEPSLGKRLKDFCNEGDQKLTPEMILEAVLLILEGDESVNQTLDHEQDPELDELVTEKRDALRRLIVTVAGQRAERRSRAGVVRRALSMAGVKVSN